MPHLPLYVLIAWVPVGAVLFRLLPPRVALLVNFLAGWMFLPGADYATPKEDFPYWIMGVALPSSYWMTKGTVTGLAALAGVLGFQREALNGARLRLMDLPMCLWCLSPAVSALAHPGQWRLAGSSVAYLALSWGVPWAMGRVFFADNEGRAVLARGLVIAGLAYLPFCLYEWIAGPVFYRLLYGYQPYQMIGAARYVGFRPVCWMEDGNQLGIWMAATAWVAISLAAWKLLKPALRIGPWAQAALLGVGTLIWQSAGAILLLVAMLPGLVLRRRWLKLAAVALIAVLVAGVAVRVSGQRLRVLPAARDGAELLDEAGKHSLLWRLRLDADDARLALKHPLVGTGEWDWWRVGQLRPWDLLLLVLGMYGAFGVVTLGTGLLLPVFRTAWRAGPVQGGLPEDMTGLALAGAALMVCADSLLNGAFPLPFLLLFGAIAAAGKIS